MTRLRSIAVIATVGALMTLAPASFGLAPGNSWGMDLTEGVVADANGTQPLSFTGEGVQATTGLVGGAIEFTRSPSFGTIANSADDNPGTQDFAMGVVFTSNPIPATRYSGNLMQKGLFSDPGQVKLQLVPANGGSVSCRIEGTLGAKIVASKVPNVDDGAWHRAVCWREGLYVGVTVDGVVKRVLFDPGSVSNAGDLHLGNKDFKPGARDQHFGRTDFATWVVGLTARSIVDLQVLTSG